MMGASHAESTVKAKRLLFEPNIPPKHGSQKRKE